MLSARYRPVSTLVVGGLILDFGTGVGKRQRLGHAKNPSLRMCDIRGVLAVMRTIGSIAEPW
jgi:hypothetical protein